MPRRSRARSARTPTRKTSAATRRRCGGRWLKRESPGLCRPPSPGHGLRSSPLRVTSDVWGGGPLEDPPRGADRARPAPGSRPVHLHHAEAATALAEELSQQRAAAEDAEEPDGHQAAAHHAEGPQDLRVGRPQVLRGPHRRRHGLGARVGPLRGAALRVVVVRPAVLSVDDEPAVPDVVDGHPGHVRLRRRRVPQVRHLDLPAVLADRGYPQPRLADREGREPPRRARPQQNGRQAPALRHPGP
mmetsp:Transcript_102970/g.279817  ORF Transcript_102970/g.279817 Transcript_102970/m.279817 type:complete len:245 (-) Transcript_102970:64-798(-)